jgi:hypothetical protein
MTFIITVLNLWASIFCFSAAFNIMYELKWLGIFLFFLSSLNLFIFIIRLIEYITIN